MKHVSEREKKGQSKKSKLQGIKYIKSHTTKYYTIKVFVSN